MASVRDKKCISCDTLIFRDSTRCSSCAQKERFKAGAWNKGIPNTWYNLYGLQVGWDLAKAKISERIEKICQADDCKKLFFVPKCFNDRIYCSKACSYKYRNNVGHTGHTHSPEARKRMSEVRSGRPSPVKGKPNLNMRGDKHPNWKGGITTFDRQERIKFRRSMQKLIFERDSYICQLCGSKTDLQVDHIQSWSEYIELRFSMDNCRTVCARCHYEITFRKPMPEDIKGWGHNLLKGEVNL